MSSYNELAAACQSARTSKPVKYQPHHAKPTDPKRITLAMVRDSVIVARKSPGSAK